MHLDPWMIVVSAIAWIVSVGLHEAGHAYAAHALGDDTPEINGRLTLNPFAHLKPVQTAIVLPILFLVLRGGLLGCATTPINPSNFRKPLRDRLLVAAAGPAVNLLLAAATIGVFLLLQSQIPRQSLHFALFHVMSSLNLTLLLFNLLPIPPLDGGDVLRYFLGPRARETFDAIGQFGFIIALVLLNIPAVAVVFWTPIALVQIAVFGTMNPHGL